MTVGKTLFVTCGATVPFPDLVECVINEKFIVEIIKNGYTRLVVQFGTGYESTFLTLLSGLNIANCTATLSDSKKIPNGDFSIYGSNKTPVCRTFNKTNGHDEVFSIVGFGISMNVEQYIKDNVDLVISHAGTGSILDSLKLKKPLIVCVNTSLMDNHQEQIANKFGSMGYVLACHPKLDELIEKFDESQVYEFKEFPTSKNVKFENLLKTLAYK
ncbi:N-acetylglucosaminyldiphosphodolichol N-acetylglucosaminyltransferase catalytic subunit ALG13 NDAI_0H00440 [Naumovozyma dairenensis CBS 421]|uniref:UDP-N-acetylglucosamine transferase subunit ALG13 n=1 Tax=Naumovozyma dairenensis (strain ATCC 10597 / BCRC 20456 / CBS 421 / NBRC 0211 / NRRL Y-12639) TaxID=1071378 RepID=G0WEK7_NAUDC|nr:hypothetical protein NDAI_0H00440 [Naumovozyma dairenensis CBS 421]CCD26218.1 hypothetical protein NDAI_0H00440 [Naumovozyma dairenensis CBS 421]